jgi:hypothetical protein
MSTVTSSTFKAPRPPAPLTPSGQRAATPSSDDSTRLVSQVGFWASVVTAAGGLGWIVAVTLAGAGIPGGQWGLVTQFAPSLFLALAYVALIVAIRERAPVERRIWASLALPVATMYATLNATVYFVELTLVTPKKLSGNLGNLGFLDMKSGLYLFAVDVFGYGLMSLAAALVAPTFGRSSSPLERWIHGLLTANWIIVIFGPPIMMFWSQGVPLMLVWAAVWMVTIPLPAILLAVLFRREENAAA